jgi:hypothetical protein
VLTGTKSTRSLLLTTDAYGRLAAEHADATNAQPVATGTRHPILIFDAIANA